MSDVQQLILGAIQGLASSTIFVLALIIGFCTIVGFTKLKKTAGGRAMVIKSLDEMITHQPMVYLSARRAARPNRPAEDRGTRGGGGLVTR